MVFFGGGLDSKKLWSKICGTLHNIFLYRKEFAFSTEGIYFSFRMFHTDRIFGKILGLPSSVSTALKAIESNTQVD